MAGPEHATPVPVHWMTAFLDSEAGSASATERFWSGVTGHAISERRGAQDEFATLLPPRGAPYLKVQVVGEAPPSAVHLDLHTGDVDGLSTRARSLGAEVRPHVPGYAVCTSPGGLTFCIVDHRADGEPPPPAGWPGGRSIVDQVCLDIPPGRWEAECAFWAGLTGWELFDVGEEHPEFRRLRAPAGLALQFLLQRLDDEQPTVTTHLDLSADDRDAEVERHLGLGASDPHRYDWWTSLRDPAGRRYCVTRRHPRSS